MMKLRAMLLVAFSALVFGTLLGPAAAQLPKPMKESEIKAAGGRQIPGPELKQQWVGNTVYVLVLKKFGAAGVPGAVIANYYPNERTRRQKFPGTQKTIETNWWMDGNNRCVEEKGATISGHLCSTAWELAGTFYLCFQPDGDCAMSFRNVPGNPESL